MASEIKPQEGPQFKFCSSPADFVIYGGAAGGGKTLALLIDPLRNINDPAYNAIIFRRKFTEITLPGAMWDTSLGIYTRMGGVPNIGAREWMWPKGGKIKFAHLNEEKSAYDHQGGQYAYIGFDEVTEFSQFQVMYLLTRNRPPDNCFVKPCARATCNPDSDSWVAKFISWWWNVETGFAIPERSGIIRYFHIVEYAPEWVDADWRDEDGNSPLSCTFIPAKLSDNPILVQRDPTYKAKLAAMDKVTRARLLEGNWLITYGGNMFDPAWFEIVDDYPRDMRLVRYWDFAATEEKKELKNDPDWTAGGLCGIKDGVLYILDITKFREKPGRGEEIIKNCAVQDGRETEIWWEEEKGSAGKWTSEYLKKVFTGYEAYPDPVSGSKVERAKPWAAWAEFGKVKLLRGEWNRAFLGQASKFPDGKKDMVDSISGCFKSLVGPKKIFSLYIPNEAGHFKSFSRTLEDFQKIQRHNAEVYVSLWAEKDGTVCGGCYIWSLKNKRLRQYNEIYMVSPTAQQIVAEVTSKAVVPMSDSTGWLSVQKVIANEEFFNLRHESMAKEVRRAGLRVRQNVVYDEQSAVMKIASMFAEGGIILHSDCVETDIQWRSWAYDDKGKVQPGFPLARTLCLLVSELRSSGKMTEYAPLPAYSRSKQALRDNLRMGGPRTDLQKINPINNDKQYEYLTR